MFECSKTGGNVLFLILIAVALFAALAYAITGSMRGGNGENGANEKSQVSVASILAYQSGIKVAIDRMTVGGTITADDIDFTRPQDASFNTPPYDKKLFHPQGGGVIYRDISLADANNPLWQKTIDYAYLILDQFNPISTAFAIAQQQAVSGGFVGRFNNFGWSPSSAQDIVFTAAKISKATCQALNQKFTDSTAIPSITSAQQYLIASSYTGVVNADFTSSQCSACNNQPAMCVADTSNGFYYFYNMVVSR